MKFLLVFVLLSPIVITAQNSLQQNIKAISDDILENGKAYSNLRVLCKTVGNRLSGSPQMYKAEDWGVAALKAAGADVVYKQACQVPHWVRGAKEVFKNPAGKSLNVLALGNSMGSGPSGIKAPLILINSFEELEQQKENIKGKIVFYNHKFNKKLLGGGYGDAQPYRGQGPSRAAKYGAVAVVVRSVTAANDNNPHTGALRYNDSFPKIPAVAIGALDADALAAQMKKDYRGGQFFLKTNCQMLPDTLGHNIIGEIKGSTYPDEVITIGGHLDSWDVAEGAHDDGTGVVQSIEVLRVLKQIGYKPLRTIRIVLFANEENGLAGGTKYMEEAKAKGEKHIMAMESDGGGESPKGFVCGMTEGQYEKVKEWRQYFTAFDADKFVFAKNGGGGADIGPLQKVFGTAQFGFNTVGNRYFDYHHAATDVFENVHERELHMGAVVMALMVYLVDQNGL